MGNLKFPFAFNNGHMLKENPLCSEGINGYHQSYLAIKSSATVISHHDENFFDSAAILTNLSQTKPVVLTT